MENGSAWISMYLPELFTIAVAAEGVQECGVKLVNLTPTEKAGDLYLFFFLLFRLFTTLTTIGTTYVIFAFSIMRR
jgi:hypothetical protein